MSHLHFSIIIPARYASTRLPGKPLADLLGKPMIVRVAEQAALSGAAQTVIATDDQRIIEAVTAYGFNAVLTQPSHPTGTDRLSEVVDLLGLPDDEIVVNVQGDEPLIDPAVIRLVASTLATHDECTISTAAYPIASFDEWQNPNVVKVVCDREGHALYFSRAPIPFSRNHQLTPTSDFPAYTSLPHKTALRHLGIYGYRTNFLKVFPELPPAPLEELECLEQLRALSYGYKIAVAIAPTAPGFSVDTPEDLAQVRRHLQTKSNKAPTDTSAPSF